MAVVGSAEVVIRVIADRIRGDIKRALDASAKDADRAGIDVADRFVDNFAGRLKERLGREIKTELDNAVGGIGPSVGSKLGSDIGSGIQRGAREGADRAGSDIGRSVRRGATPGLREVGRDAARAGGSAGGGFASAFSRAASSGGGGRGFSSIFLKLIVLTPVIAAVVGALGSLVSALIAVGSAAIFAAAGGLAILPGIIGGLLVGVGTLVVAFSGVSDAFSAMGKARAGAAKDAIAASRRQEQAERRVTSALRGVETANNRLIDAQQNLERTRRQVARGSEDAARRLQDAERRVADAQRNAQRAQESLTRARKDAKDKLDDLQMSLRGAVLGEQEATLRLSEARIAYQETMNDPESERNDFERARLDLMQAELALDQARARREDVTEETQEANRLGIEGSAEVKDAVESIGDANRDVADSELDLRRAREDQVNQAIDGAQQIADAQRSILDAQQGILDAERDLADARRDAADALNEEASAAADLATAMAALSPAAQEFVKVLDSFRGKFKELKFAIQEAFFPALTDMVKVFLGNPAMFSVFKTGLTDVATALGNVVRLFTTMFSDATAQSDLASFFRTSATVTEAFGSSLVILLRAFTSLTAGAEPFITRFSDNIVSLSERFNAFIERVRGDGTLTTFFTTAFEAARGVGDFLGGAFMALWDVIEAATPSGIALLDIWTKGMQNFRDVQATPEGAANLTKFFQDAIPNATAILELLGELAAAIVRIGNTPALETIADTLKNDLIPPLESFITNVLERFGPQIADIAVDIASFLDSMSKSAVLKFLVDQLSQLTGVVADLAQNGAIREIAAALIAAAIAGAVFKKAMAFSRLLGPVGTFITLLKGGLVHIARFVLGLFGIRRGTSTARTGMFQLGTAVRSTLAAMGAGALKVVRAFALGIRALGVAMKANPLGAVVAVLTLIGTGLFLAYQKFEGFRNVVDTVVGAVVGAFQWLYDILLGNSIIPDIVDGAIAAFTFMKDIVVGVVNVLKNIVASVFDALKMVVQLIWDGISAYFRLWFTIVSTIFSVGWTVIKVVVETVFNAIKTTIETIFGVISSIFRGFVAVVSFLWRNFWNGLKIVGETVFNVIKFVVSNVFNGIRIIFETVIAVIRGIWSRFWDGLSSIASTIFNGVKTVVDRVLGGIKSGFETTVATVKRVWEGFREAVSAPIRSVVDVAYNKGIVKFWNRVAGVVNAPKLEEVKFAKGGYVPGYAPGRDTVRAVLSPGEGVLVPEAVRGLARQMGTTPARAIQQINSQWTSRVPGSGSGRFAGGGYVSKSTRNAWGGPVDWLKTKWDDTVDWVAGQLAKSAQFALDGIHKVVDAVVPRNDVGDLMRAVPKEIGSKITSWLTGKDKESNETPSVAAGGEIGNGRITGSYKNLVSVFTGSKLPGVVTSTVRRPRFPGDQSNHIRGKAADFSGNHGNRGYGAKVLRDIFHLFVDKYGSGLNEVILAGAPFNIKRGKKVAGYSWGRPGSPGNHWNHVHVAAMAKGGTVLPRPGGTLAVLGEAGKAESVVDTGLLNKRLADLAIARSANGDVVSELRRVEAILQRIESLGGGIRIDRIDARTGGEQQQAFAVARSLRSLAFELGQ